MAGVKKTGNIFARFFIINIFILFFKHQGLPPQARSSQ